MELVDTPDLGSGAIACGFESHYPHIMRDRAEVARQSHKLEVVGSSPAPATSCLGIGNPSLFLPGLETPDRAASS